MSCSLEDIKRDSTALARKAFKGNSKAIKFSGMSTFVHYGTKKVPGEANAIQMIARKRKEVEAEMLKKLGSKEFSTGWIVEDRNHTNKIKVNIVFPEQVREAYEEKIKREEAKAAYEEAKEIEAIKDGLNPPNTPTDIEGNPLYQLTEEESSTKPEEVVEAKVKHWLELIGIKLEAVTAIFNSKGVEVNANAVADVLKKTIQYIEGKVQPDTFSEEAAHVLTAILKANNRGLYNSMAHNVKKLPEYAKVLEDYKDVYETEEEFIDEAIGKVIVKHLQGEEVTPATVRLIDKIKAFLNKLLEEVGISLELFKTEIDPFMLAADMILNPSNTEVNSETLTQIGSSYKGIQYYQLTNKEEEDYISHRKRLTDLQNPDNSPIIKNANGYLVKRTQMYAKRVSDFVNEYYETVFGKSDTGTKKAMMAAIQGTKLHSTYEYIAKEYLRTGKLPIKRDIKAAVYEELKDHEDFKEFDAKSPIWNYGAYQSHEDRNIQEIKKGVKDLIDSIKQKGIDIQKLTGTTNETEFFFETSLYDELHNVAGTIDLMVLYPNGSVAIYDFKNKVFKTDSKGRVIEDMISSFLDTAYNTQLENYKNLNRIVLDGLKGDVTFAESRIIPINMQLNYKNPEIIHSLEMGVAGKNGNRGYLQQISVAGEKAGHEGVDMGLKQLYNLQESLVKKIDDSPRDANLRTRLKEVRSTIQTYLIQGKAYGIVDKIDKLKEEYRIRMLHSSEDPVSIAITEEYDSYIKAYSKLLEGIRDQAREQSEKTSDKGEKSKLLKMSKAVNDVLGDVAAFKNEIRSKVSDILDRLDPNSSLKDDYKETSGLGKLLKQLSQFNHPAFKRLSKMVGLVQTSVQKRLDEFRGELNTHIKELEEFAAANNMDVNDIYNKIVNSKTGNLTGKYTDKYYEEKKKAQTDKDNDWLIKNTQIAYDEKKDTWSYTKDALTKYHEKKANHLKYLNSVYPGKDKVLVERRNDLMQKWEYENNITLNFNVIYNKKNNLILLEDNKAYYNDSWKFISENKAVEKYYNFYVDMNQKFAELTGRDINDRFVANIHIDTMEAMTNVGVGTTLNVAQQLRDSTFVRQYDTTMGVIDVETGEVKNAIPLMYFDGLRKGLSSKEISAIEGAIVAEGEYERGSKEYISEFKSRIFKEERKKALQYKSKDLSRSLLLFAESAFTNHFYKESESMAQSLLLYFQNDQNVTNRVATDQHSKTIVNRFTNKVQKIFGVSHSDVDALEKFIKLYWYGQNMQSKDVTVKSEIKDSEGNLITTEYFSTTKGIKAMMSYISMKALGLNAFSAFGNAVGIGLNTWFLTKENRELTKEGMGESLNELRNNRIRFRALSDIVKPYSHSINYEYANNMSASKLAKIFTMENMYFLMKHPDVLIDKLVTNTMARSYGISKDGQVVRLALDNTAKPIIDYLKEDKEGNFELTITPEQLTTFRRKVQASSSKIKGSIPQENKALWITQLITTMMFHFRSWMPGLIRTRFKPLSYDADMNELDVGRYKVFVGEMIGEGFSPKNIGNIINRLLPLYEMRTHGDRNVSREVSLKYFNEFEANDKAEFEKYLADVSSRYPELSIAEVREKALDEFMDMREAKIRALVAELKALMYISLIMLAVGAAPDDEDSAMKFIRRNAILFLTRGYLELSFFYDVDTPKMLLAAPIPAMRIVYDAQSAMTNFVQETNDLVRGIDNKQDHTPFGYYTATKFIPLMAMVNRVFDPFDNYDHK